MSRPEFCEKCPIAAVTEGYVPLCPSAGTELWVGEAAGEEEATSSKPFVGGAGSWLNSLLRAAKISRSRLNIVNCLGCKPAGNCFPTDPKFAETTKYYWEKAAAQALKRLGPDSPQYKAASARAQAAQEITNADGKAAVEYCAEKHLWPAVNSRKWTRLVALGDQALKALTPRQGISLWRGSPLQLRGHEGDGPKVIGTLHPAFIARQSSMFSVVKEDLRKSVTLPPEKYNLYPTIDEVRAFDSTEFAFDFEWDPWGQITMCGLSDKYYSALVVPWCEPFIEELRRIFESAKALIGHNIIGADTKWFEKFGWNITAKLFDTMLIQHLVQPDMRHGLAFVASVFTNKVFWKGDGEEQEDDEGNYLPTGAQWRTWDSPNAIPKEFGGYGGCRSADEAYRLYNARDTDASYQCLRPLLNSLKSYEMEHTYWNVSAPVAFICRDMTESGLKLDSKRLAEVREDLNTQITSLEVGLPAGLAPIEVPVTKQIAAPAGTYRPKTKICKGGKKYGGPHEPREFVFSMPGTTVCACGAQISAGKMTEAKVIRVPDTKRVVPWNSSEQVKKYADSIGCKPYVNSKTGNASADKNARKAWGRQHTEFSVVDQLKQLVTLKNNFAKEGLLQTDRMFFNLLVHGTSEGRLASSGRRRGIDLNIQNCPKEFRKVFIPDFPGWGYLNLDIVQGENCLTAWLAKDWDRWERLNTPGFDEHSFMAASFFNKPVAEVSKGGALEALRKPGKVINHGRNYGLGVRKTQEYLAAQGFFYSLPDITEMIEIWKKINKRTAEWQQETIGIAAKQGYLMNVFGRRRWFQGKDFATKALAFLPASTLADMVLRMMIALYAHKFPQEVVALGLQTTGRLPDPWALRIQVHDSLVAQGPDENHLDAARIMSAVMTQPWPQLDNFKFKVETEYSAISWGDVKKIDIDLPMELPLAA